MMDQMGLSCFLQFKKHNIQTNVKAYKSHPKLNISLGTDAPVGRSDN